MSLPEDPAGVLHRLRVLGEAGFAADAADAEGPLVLRREGCAPLALWPDAAVTELYPNPYLPGALSISGGDDDGLHAYLAELAARPPPEPPPFAKGRRFGVPRALGLAAALVAAVLALKLLMLAGRLAWGR